MAGLRVVQGCETLGFSVGRKDFVTIGVRQVRTPVAGACVTANHISNIFDVFLAVHGC